MKFFSLAVPAALIGCLMSGCTVHQTEAPALTGPSESALSVSVTATPDSITQDGQSNSTIAVTARDASGRPLPGVSFRLDMLVGGVPSDYGTISTRSITTGPDGKATAVYTAPAAPPSAATASGSCAGSTTAVALAGRCVQVVATSVGSNHAGNASHMVEIRLVPGSVIVPASATPVPSFTVSPAAPAANTPTLFDASKSCAGALDVNGQCPASAGAITAYAWAFGDGRAASGKTASHTFTSQQTFAVTLTVTNDRGIAASTTQFVAVGVGAGPTAAFTSSPTAPLSTQPVFFDANLSKAGAGHNLVRFVWNWGDGSPRLDHNAWTATHIYETAGTYVVTLVVADEAGQTATVTGAVTVGVPAP